MNALIPVFSGSIAGTPQQLVNARDLHSFLEVGKRFATWITDRLKDYGFVENQDFVLVAQNRATKGRGGDRRSSDYHLTLDTAKELSMVQRNDKGRQARRYFIDCERRMLEGKAQGDGESQYTELVYANHGLRILLERGQCWFVVRDVMQALDLAWTSNAVARLAVRLGDEEVRNVQFPGASPMAGSQQGVVSVPGLYRLLHTSRKPAAKGLERWLTHSALPAIDRRAGSAAVALPPEAMRQQVLLTLDGGQVVRSEAVPAGAMVVQPGQLNELLAKEGKCMVDEADLRSLASAAASLVVVHRCLMEAVDKVEAATGVELYQRTAMFSAGLAGPDRAGMTGGHDKGADDG